MSRINVGRVVLGGLVAGLVMNIGETILNVPVLGAEYETAMAALNRPPVGGGAIAMFVVMTFVLGMVMVWLYAAVRPRLGPGPKTAVIIGVLVWLMAYFYGLLGMGMMGLFPGRLIVIASIWSLVEVPLGALAGAWLYTEA